MQIKSITTVAGVNEIDFGNDDSQTTAHFYWFKNLSDSTLYVSAMPNPVAGEDNVAELSAKGAASVETDEGKVYVLGAGKVEIHRTNSKFCPFELPSTGSGGGGGGSITVDSELSETSENPLQNKATTAAINEVKSDLTKTQEDVAENAAALNTKSDVNHIHDITASGNPVTLTNLQGEVPFSEITVSGKNLISIAQAKALTGDNTNGYFVVDNASSRIFIQKLSPNTAYCIKKYDEGNRFRIVLFDNEPSTVPDKTAKQLVYNSDGSVTEYAFTTGIDYLWLVFATHFAESGDAVEPIVQLELGDTATYYEPPITSQEVTITRCGKNLLNVYIPTKREYVINNTTFTINDDGSVTAVSAETETAATRLSLSMTCPPGDYMFSGSADKDFCTYIYNRTKNTVTAWANPNPVPCRIEKENEYVLYFMVRENGKANGNACKPQLELGDTATEYEPYHGAKYTITPDSNPYVVPNDIRQVEGLNNISVSAGELSVVGVQKNAAIDKIWDILNTLKVWASLGLIPNLNCYPLIPTLISNTGSNGSASCNSDIAFGTAESAYVAFDRDTTTFLAYANENVSGGWAMYEFNSLVCISKMQALTGTGISTNSFDFHFEYYDESTDSWKMYGEELNVTGLNANNYKKFEVEAGEITTSKVRIISHTEKVEQTNWQVFEFQVYGYMSI